MTSQPKNNNSTTYEDAGVSIENGNELVERIKSSAKATNRQGVVSNLGGFGGLFDLSQTGYHNPVLVAATDGVGTKLKLAFAENRHDTIGIDLVAMCVNDLVVQGAEPLFFLDYYATSELDVNTAEHVIKGIAKGCEISGCALLGGETAEMPGMYQKGHYDLAGFAVGVAEKNALLPKQDTIEENDVILGLPSNGFHSNGYSLIRHIIDQNNINPNDSCIAGQDAPLIDLLIKPTEIYVKPCLAIKDKIKALAHITGGGITENLPRVLPEDTTAQIDCNKLPYSSLFAWLAELGNISNEEMLKTFNCGIGMTVILAKEEVETTTKILKKQGIKPIEIGHITTQQDSPVVYDNLGSLYETA